MTDGRLVWLSNPYPLLLRLSLALGLLAGFGLGLAVLLSFALQWPLPAGTGSLIQVHGQVQALGFVTLFIIAVATRVLPALHGAQLQSAPLVSLGGLSFAVGVIFRTLFQPAAPSALREVGLAIGAGLTIVGLILALTAFARTVRAGTRRREDRRVLLPATLAVSLLGTVLLTLAATAVLIAGAIVVPVGLNEALLHLELWGFASTMILAIGRNTWPNTCSCRCRDRGSYRPLPLCGCWEPC